MASVAYIDFETRSTVDLPKAGAHVYARHPDTEILCLGWAMDDGPINMWRRGDDSPSELLTHVRGGHLVVGHNIGGFEVPIWNNAGVKVHGWPELKIEQCSDTMAMAYAMAIPGSLEKAAAAMGIEAQKDAVGGRTMRVLCKPKNYDSTGIPIYVDDAEKFEILYAYCAQDVEVERQLFKRLLPLSETERAVWILDHHINERGIQVDLRCVKAALKIVDLEKEKFNARIQKISKGFITTYNETGRFRQWIETRGVSDVPSIAKADVIELLSRDNIPADVREALVLRQEAAKSSTAKLESMLLSTCPDGRIRGIFQYHGAGTGRWAGRRLQAQNLPRSTIKQELLEEVFAILEGVKCSSTALDTIDLIYGSPLKVLSECMRGFLIAKEGHEFIAADYASIEARVLAWLAGEESVLELFRNNNDVYIAAAAQIYNIYASKVTKDQRQIGKVAVLALGYGGGVKAFQGMARAFNVDVGDAEAENIKVAWRTKHPSIVKYWYDLDRAGQRAIENPGSVFTAGAKNREVKFKVSGTFLFCQLPSGRVLCYPYPEMQLADTPWGEPRMSITYLSEDLGKKFSRHKAYGGLLCENITQAVARDLLSDAMTRLETLNYPVVLHVHDEIVCEVPEGFGSVAKMENIMSALPLWATDLPVSAEGFRGKRYRK